jgi:hypothetical protein
MMGGKKNGVVFASSVILTAVIVAAAALTSDFYTSTSLPTDGGRVGPVNQPPIFTNAVFGYMNVSARLFNVSVSSMTLGLYDLNSLVGANRTVMYSVACFEANSCAIGFWVTNDTAVHDYVASANSVSLNLRLSDGETVAGSVTAVDRPVVEPGPNGGLFAERWDFISSGRVIMSNLSAIVPLNATDSSPITQLSIGGRTVNSSYFTRQTYTFPLLNGSESVIQGPLEVHGPIVYSIMQNAGHVMLVTISFEDGGQTNLSLLVYSVIFTALRP